jgi:hypothetical protein
MVRRPLLATPRLRGRRARMSSRANTTIRCSKPTAPSVKRECGRNAALLPIRNFVNPVWPALVRTSRIPALRPRAGVTTANPVANIPNSEHLRPPQRGGLFSLDYPRPPAGGVKTSTPVEDATTTIELRSTKSPLSTVPTVNAILFSTARGSASGPKRQSRMKLPPSVT